MFFCGGKSTILSRATERKDGAMGFLFLSSELMYDFGFLLPLAKRKQAIWNLVNYLVGKKWEGLSRLHWLQRKAVAFTR